MAQNQHLFVALDNKEWYKKENTNLYRKITRCGEKLKARDTPKRKITRLKEKEYKELRAQGYTLIEVSNYYSVSLSRLNQWRAQEGIKE
jgi:cobalamin biosynthesis Co2+ chelatase CbiK